MSADTKQTLETELECVKIGDWQFRVGTHELERNGETIRLEPRVASLLLYLSAQAGKPVSRSELLEALWPGVVVSDEALTNAVNKLRRAFGDERTHPQVIETIPKVGYRLIAAVATRPRVECSERDSTNNTSLTSQRSYQVPISVILVLFLLITVVIIWESTRKVSIDSVSIPTIPVSTPLPEKPSIAVLPFVNLSGDPEHEYFSDGMTEDLITDLSKISGLFVLGRNSVFSYKGAHVKAQDVNRELGVRYVLEGSVRKAGDRIRINSQLVDATTGFHVWAERFDRDLGDIFALQDEVIDKIISSLEVKLTTDEREILFRRYTNSIEAYDYFLKGWEYLWHRSKESNLIARGFFIKAIEFDSSFARAYSDLARTYARESIDGWTNTPEQTLEHAHQLTLKAIALDPELPQAYLNLSIVHLYKRAYKDAISGAEKAISLDPNYADAFVQLASILTYAGIAREALPLVETAMRLNPGFPLSYVRSLGYAYFTMGRYQDAIEAFESAIERNPSAQRTHMWLAAAYALSGRQEEAEWEVDEVLSLDAEFSLKSIQKGVPYKDPTHLNHLLEGLRKAGLPE